MSVKEAVRAPNKSASVYAQRARYVCNENGFAFSYPPVQARQFLAEREWAFDQDAASGMLDLDASNALGTAYAATTPSLLCRYIKVRAGDRLSGMVVATGEVFYVITGSGASHNGVDEIAWSRQHTPASKALHGGIPFRRNAPAPPDQSNAGAGR